MNNNLIKKMEEQIKNQYLCQDSESRRKLSDDEYNIEDMSNRCKKNK
jgi:hypothetical protein